MLKLRINPIVAKDLKDIRDYIAEDNEEYAAKTINEIYGKFENLQMFPGMGSDLSKRVSFRTDYKYAIWEEYMIIYKVGNEYNDIYSMSFSPNTLKVGDKLTYKYNASDQLYILLRYSYPYKALQTTREEQFQALQLAIWNIAYRTGEANASEGYKLDKLIDLAND